MNTEAKDQFGDNILDLVDGYYKWKHDNPNAANEFLDVHPQVSQYMDWKAERVMGSPLLSAYYGGASMIEGYYRSKMYADIEVKMGEEIFEVMDEYNDIKDYGTPAEIKAFENSNKAKIKQYYAMRDEWQLTIDRKVAELSAQIPESEGAQVRQDYSVTSPKQTQLAGAVETQAHPQPTFQDFQAMIPT